MQIDIEQYFIDESSEKANLPPLTLQTFLTYHGVLRRHQQISKKKLKILTNLFHTFLTNNLKQFLHELSESPTECLTILPLLIRLPRLLANIQEKPELYNIQQILFESIHLFSLDCQLKIIEIVNLQDPQAIQAVQDIVIANIRRLPRKQSYFQQAFKKNDKSMLLEMAQQISHQELFTLMHNIIYSSIVDVYQTDLLYSIIQKLPNDKYQELFRRILLDWSTSSFSRVRVPKSHKVITNILLNMMDQCNLDNSETIQNINQGVFSRFDNFKEDNFICEAAAFMIKRYATKKGLEKGEGGMSLEEMEKLYPGDKFTEDRPKQIQHKSTQSVKEQTTEKIDIEIVNNNYKNHVQLEILDQAQQPALVPLNLYDCELALNSQNRKRKAGCLKQLPRLIKQHTGQLVFCYSSLTNNLLYCQDETHMIPNFNNMKKQCLISLLDYKPIEVIEILTNYFYKDRLLADKIIVMQVIGDAIRQLSQNQPQPQPQNEQFYFKRVQSRYLKAEKQQKLTKQPESVRRWGHTKIAYEKGQSLLPIKRQELLVQHNNYNRFYTVCDQLFFRFMIPLRNQHRQLRDRLFCLCLIDLLIIFTENIKNYHEKYKILDEMLDLHDMIKIRDVQIQKRKLTLLYKISCSLDQHITNHEIFFNKLVSVIQHYQSDREPWFDGSLKMILGMACQNVRQVLPRMPL